MFSSCQFALSLVFVMFLLVYWNSRKGIVGQSELLGILLLAYTLIIQYEIWQNCHKYQDTRSSFPLIPVCGSARS